MMFSGLCYSVPVGRYKPQAVNISCSSKTCQNKDKNNCQPCCYVKLTLISVLNKSSGVYSIVLLTCVFNGNPTKINEFSIFLDKSNRKTRICLYRFFSMYLIQANIFWHYVAMNIGQLSYMQWTFDYNP